jgi:hypothetical protein
VRSAYGALGCLSVAADTVDHIGLHPALGISHAEEVRTPAPLDPQWPETIAIAVPTKLSLGRKVLR